MWQCQLITKAQMFNYCAKLSPLSRTPWATSNLMESKQCHNDGCSSYLLFAVTIHVDLDVKVIASGILKHIRKKAFKYNPSCGCLINEHTFVARLIKTTMYITGLRWLKAYTLIIDIT